MSTSLATRRSFLASLCALPLLGCTGGQTATVRYRLIATAYVDGEKVESSSVMEVRYKRVTNTLSGSGGDTTLYGEALVLDLKRRGSVFILPTMRATDGTLREIYEHGILSTLGIKHGVGSLTDADFERLRNAKGRMLFQYYSAMPIFVVFGDERIPKSIQEISPSSLNAAFPGCRFGSLDVEITQEKPTRLLKSRLPWLNSPLEVEVFERFPPGHKWAAKSSPLGFLITKGDFFGNGTR